jgi:hypothetical protein
MHSGGTGLRRLLRDTVAVFAPDGTPLKENVMASIQRNRIHIYDTSIPLTPGCIIARRLPSQHVEEFIVEDPGFVQGMNRQLPSHYEATLRRRDALAKEPSSVTYILSDNARVTIGGTDASNNVIITQIELFQKLKEAAASIQGDEQEAIVQSIVEMEKEAGKPTFIGRYKDFMSLAAAHMTVFAPMISALTGLLSHAK